VSKLFYPTAGVLRGEDDFIVGIKNATIDDKNTITVNFTDGTSESFETKDGNIEPYRSGRASFTLSNGEQYSILPVESTDGEWISQYKISLPVSNLKKTLLNSQESTTMPYLENAGERMLAFQLPEDEYVFGVLYVNQYGAFMRKNGVWVEVSPIDSMFDDTTPYEIGRDNASEFVVAFDGGALKIEDAQEFLIPVAQESK
jgi:hypothetical protein